MGKQTKRPSSPGGNAAHKTKQVSASKSPASLSAKISKKITWECEGHCNWVLDENLQWQCSCGGCDQTQTCYDPDVAGTNPTPCEPLTDFPSISNDQGDGVNAAGTCVLLRIPKINDPTVWRAFGLYVRKVKKRIFDQRVGLGWIVTIKEENNNVNEPEVDPQTLPVDLKIKKPEDIALCASVLLPEGKDYPKADYQQYWVPLLEQKGNDATVLRTPHWTVEFKRNPIP